MKIRSTWQLSLLRRTQITLALLLLQVLPAAGQKALVLQSDFGTADGAVASMKGVAHTVSATLQIFDLTHEIEPFNIWQAAYRLRQTAPYWPAGTVFVSVVDPGVGTTRKAIVLRTRSGHIFVSPDNGTLTLVAEELGIEEARVVDERVNRRPHSGQSHTFHGRDVFAFVGARLAAGVIAFEQVGPSLGRDIVRLSYQKATRRQDMLLGAIPVLDVRYGNVWTNIPRVLFDSLGVRLGQQVAVQIFRGEKLVFDAQIPFVRTFADVPEGKPLLYFNSLDQIALALNQGDFARTFAIKAGLEWLVELRKR